MHHVHRELYLGEFGRLGHVLAWVLETMPLRLLYRRTPFLTISRSACDDLVGVGIPPEHITVEYLGVEGDAYHRRERSPEPRLVYVGRLKAYKRIEIILDVLEAIPGAHLDIVGDGDHRENLEAEITRRRLGDRVTMHGYVSEERKAELYARAWVSLTASSSEGWSLTVMESALCGTPSAAMAIGGPADPAGGEQPARAARPGDDGGRLPPRPAGLVVIAHGSSSSIAIANAIRLAARGIEHDLVARLGETLPERVVESSRSTNPSGRTRG